MNKDRFEQDFKTIFGTDGLPSPVNKEREAQVDALLGEAMKDLAVYGRCAVEAGPGHARVVSQEEISTVTGTTFPGSKYPYGD